MAKDSNPEKYNIDTPMSNKRDIPRLHRFRLLQQEVQDAGGDSDARRRHPQPPSSAALFCFQWPIRQASLAILMGCNRWLNQKIQEVRRGVSGKHRALMPIIKSSILCQRSARKQMQAGQMQARLPNRTCSVGEEVEHKQ